MASRSALIALLVAVSCVAAASADTSFTVGDGQGWTLGVDYNGWTSGKTFSANDKLVFNFATGSHTVAEVTKSDYDACSSSSAANTLTTGPATVILTPGTHYYICTIGTHCSGGMKLAVAVGSGSGSGSPATPSTPGTPSTPTPTTPTPTGSSARLQAAGPALAVAAGVLVKLALF